MDLHADHLLIYTNLQNALNNIANNIIDLHDQLQALVLQYNEAYANFLFLSNQDTPNLDSIEILGVATSDLRSRIQNVESVIRVRQQQWNRAEMIRGIHYLSLVSAPMLIVNGVASATILLDLHLHNGWNGTILLGQIPLEEVDEVDDILGDGFFENVMNLADA